MQKTVDCIIVGYNEPDLQTLMASAETMKQFSGAYNFMTHQVVRFRGQWYSYLDLLNIVLQEVSPGFDRLHPMETGNLGVYYLASFLMRKSLHVEIINFYTWEKDRLRELLSENPRAVAITTTFYLIDDTPIKEIVQFIRQYNSETTIIVGGPHTFSLCHWEKDITTQDYMLKNIGADIYINDSQGETTLLEVLKELRKNNSQNLEHIPNLICKHHLAGSPAESKKLFLRTPKAPENNDLDENVIDWSLFPSALYTPTAYIRTARGCAFSCSFCNFQVLAGPLSLTSLENIEQEMQQLHEAGVKYLMFVDDTFNVPLPRFKKILRMMIENRFNFHWVSHFRCSNADDEAFELMRESGCKGVLLGIESGDQQILRNMNKSASIDAYKRGIRELNRRGIITFVSLIVGFPGETRESIQNTINFIEETRPTYYQAGLYLHLERFPIHQEAEKYGLHGSIYSWRHNTMDWKEASDMIKLMYTTIQGSIIAPAYIFHFWAILYLRAKGISPEYVYEFLTLTQPLLLKNIAPETLNEHEEEKLYRKLLILGNRIAHDIELRNINYDIFEYANQTLQ